MRSYTKYYYRSSKWGDCGWGGQGKKALHRSWKKCKNGKDDSSKMGHFLQKEKSTHFTCKISLLAYFSIVIEQDFKTTTTKRQLQFQRQKEFLRFRIWTNKLLPQKFILHLSQLTYWGVLAFFDHPCNLHPCKQGRQCLHLQPALWAGSKWIDLGAISLGVQSVIQAARTVISFTSTLLIRNAKGPSTWQPKSHHPSMYAHSPKDVWKNVHSSSVHISPKVETVQSLTAVNW